jgi:hypothetical protein
MDQTDTFTAYAAYAGMVGKEKGTICAGFT